MVFGRVVGAWVAVWAVLIAWRALERGVRGGEEPLVRSLGHSAGALAVEALLLTLLGGLWFASLGSGSGWLVFLLVGLLVEVPHRLRTPEGRAAFSWKPVAGGVVRVLLAGVACGVVMGV